MRAAIAEVLGIAGYSVQTLVDAVKFLDFAMTGQAGCAALDVRMFGLNGLELQRRLRNAPVTLPIIFVTGYADVPMSVAAMKAGAADFLTKPFREQDLLDAVAQAVESESASRAERGEVARHRIVHSRLNQRERSILTQAVDGRRNKVIAGPLGLSEITMKIARAKLMQKLGVQSIAELARVAERLKLSYSNTLKVAV